jgi:TrmH family RNA methyltransferase
VLLHAQDAHNANNKKYIRSNLIIMLSKTKAQWIRSLKIKKYRDELGYYFVEGEKIIIELFNSPAEIDAIYATEAIADKLNLVDAWIVDEKQLAAISNLDTPPGCMAVVKIPTEVQPLSTQNILILDAIRDPGNLGTIIRTADWFGINHIVCSLDCVDAYNPKTVQASMGSVFRVEIRYVDIALFVAQHPHYNLYVSHLDGDILQHQNIKQPFALAVGNESNGVGVEILKSKHQKVKIEGKQGRAESLNAAVANGILLNHFFKYI